LKARIVSWITGQDRGIQLSEAERLEAEGLMDLVALLALLPLRVDRAAADD
jgi:hypothetical protein